MADMGMIQEIIELEEVELKMWETEKRKGEINSLADAFINRINITIEALKEKQERESEPEIKHLFYKHRMQLSELYMKWLQRYNILDSSMSVLAFLEGNGLLNREKCLAFIEESEGGNDGK